MDGLVLVLGEGGVRRGGGATSCGLPAAMDYPSRTTIPAPAAAAAALLYRGDSARPCARLDHTHISLCGMHAPQIGTRLLRSLTRLLLYCTTLYTVS